MYLITIILKQIKLLQEVSGSSFKIVLFLIFFLNSGQKAFKGAEFFKEPAENRGFTLVTNPEQELVSAYLIQPKLNTKKILKTYM